MIIFSGSVFHDAVKGTEKVLPSPQILAVWRSLHKGKQRFGIRQDYKLVSSQLNFKKV